MRIRSHHQVNPQGRSLDLKTLKWLLNSTVFYNGLLLPIRPIIGLFFHFGIASILSFLFLACQHSPTNSETENQSQRTQDSISTQLTTAQPSDLPSGCTWAIATDGFTRIPNCPDPTPPPPPHKQISKTLGD